MPMRKATRFLIVLLTGALIGAASLVAHYRALHRDTLAQWAGAEAAWRQRSAVVSAEVGPGTLVSAVATRLPKETVATPDPALPFRSRIGELETQIADRDSRIAALLQASTNHPAARGP